ncbi:MAG: ATP-dependent Clp protease proteolytic subunit, partial [Candidatus Hydrogenedentales bacterium]
MTRLLLAFAHLVPLFAAAPATGQDEIGDVVIVCPIEGMIDEGIAVIVERAVEEANEKGAKALIFRIDTPGGRVDSAVKIASAIQRSRTLTIAYIEGMGAISAGALISMACDEIVMAPGSNIGAAAPVIPTAEGMQPTGEKE